MCINPFMLTNVVVTHNANIYVAVIAIIVICNFVFIVIIIIIVDHHTFR